MKEYVLSFIIGSSILSYILVSYPLKHLDLDYYNFNGYTYYILVPIYFGIINMLSLYFSKKYKLSKFNRLIGTSIISSGIIISIAYYFKLYNWKNKNRKYRYPLINFTGHLSTYFIIIYLLEEFIK